MELSTRPTDAAVDHGSVLELLVEPGNEILGWCLASPATLEPASLDRGRRPMLSAVASVAIRERDLRRHLGGGRHSLARQVPRDRGWYLVVALTATSVSIWDFGVTQRRMPTAAVATFPREMLTSVRRLGTADLYGIDTRFRFADRSFIDLKVMEHPELAQFWAAAA